MRKRIGSKSESCRVKKEAYIIMKQMTEYQRELVTQHLDLVDKVIRCRIGITGGPLLTYDDFYAVGCEALCRAAMYYQPAQGPFEFLAKRYMYNAMIDHCRKENPILAAKIDYDLETDYDSYATVTAGEQPDLDDIIYHQSVSEALRQCKLRYTGISLKFIESIELKSLCFDTNEIAAKYDTTVNNINAWISRARSKLRLEPEFLQLEY